MNINIDPDTSIVEITGNSYRLRRATLEEYRESKRKRLTKLKVELERQLYNINKELSILRTFNE